MTMLTTPMTPRTFRWFAAFLNGLLLAAHVAVLFIQDGGSGDLVYLGLVTSGRRAETRAPENG